MSELKTGQHIYYVVSRESKSAISCKIVKGKIEVFDDAGSAMIVKDDGTSLLDFIHVCDLFERKGEAIKEACLRLMDYSFDEDISS